MKKNKYHSKKCRCNQDHIHHSRAEAEYCNWLALLQRNGDIRKYEIQKKFKFDAMASHYADFWVKDNDDTYHVEEYKGFETDIWRLKLKMFKKYYPDIPYFVVKKIRGRFLRKKVN